MSPLSNLPITMGCGLYDRMVPLYSGEVKPEGIDLTYVAIDVPSQVYQRMFAGEFHVGEMSCSDYLRRVSSQDSAFIAIPVFPSKVFRHGMIWINPAAGIRSPKDLEGKRVGVPSFMMTAALWIRGLLQEEYGVDLTTIDWVQELPFRSITGSNAAEDAIARRYRIRTTDGKPLEQVMDAGEIDAYIGADVPEAMRRSPHARRLFPNYKELEQAYYRRTKIFPIMHTFVIRNDVYAEHPFVAKAMYEALDRSKNVQRQKMRYMGTLRYMLPWMIEEIEEVDALFGGDPFVYGLKPNRPTLEAALRYLSDQAQLSGPVDLDKAFVDVGA